MTEQPGRRRIFYGWFVVGASVIGLAFSWPVFAIYTFGPFVIPLSTEFGWQRGEMSAAITVVSWTAMFVSLALGFMVDRLGVRPVMLPSIVLLGLTVASMYFLTGSLWHFYATYFLIAVLGAGTSILVFSKLVLNWFDRKRGLALGISIAGVGVGQAIVPLVATHLIVNFGWRLAFVALGLLVIVLSGGVILLLIRESPDEMGLHKDGALPVDAASSSSHIISGYTVKQAAATRPFWLMLFSFFLVGFCIHGAAVHLMPLLQDRGIPATRAAQILSALGFAVIFGRILGGYLMDRVFAPYVGIAFMLGPVIGLAMLALGASGGWALAAAILLGLAIGAEFDILGYFTSRYAGLKAYGMVYGIMLACFQLGGGIGPYVMGIGFDRTGSYDIVLWTFCAMFLTSCILFGLLGPYPDLPETTDVAV